MTAAYIFARFLTVQPITGSNVTGDSSLRYNDRYPFLDLSLRIGMTAAFVYYRSLTALLMTDRNVTGDPSLRIGMTAAFVYYRSLTAFGMTSGYCENEEGERRQSRLSPHPFKRLLVIPNGAQRNEESRIPVIFTL